MSQACKKLAAGVALSKLAECQGEDTSCSMGYIFDGVTCCRESVGRVCFILYAVRDQAIPWTNNANKLCTVRSKAIVPCWRGRHFTTNLIGRKTNQSSFNLACMIFCRRNSFVKIFTGWLFIDDPFCFLKKIYANWLDPAKNSCKWSLTRGTSFGGEIFPKDENTSDKNYFY